MSDLFNTETVDNSLHWSLVKDINCPKVKSIKLLALDIATKTGWCTETTSGTWDFQIKRDESSGFRLIRFKAKLKEICSLEGITMVVFERSAGQYKSSIIVQSELHGVLKLFCEEHSIQYKAYSAKEIKLQATGKGNASKAMMVKSAKDKYGYKGESEDEADAIHIYHLAKKDLHL